MSKKILIVDDEPFNLDLLEQELAEYEYVIDRAADGVEALAKTQSFAPDLILLDYMMPRMGATLSIPILLKQARIDVWLVDVMSPLIVPFIDSPVRFFLVIALLTYVLKLVFTSFLTVVTLSVALLPLSIDVGMSPWIIAMIILIASEVWFFPYQVDWHMLAYSTTEGKGFSYPLMCRINIFYALAYIVALIVAIPYWRYLGLIG